MADAFLQTQLTNTENLITAYTAALNALLVDGIQSYTLDTGQTRQTVTNADIPQMNKALDNLLSRRATLKASCQGGTIIGVPGW